MFTDSKKQMIKLVIAITILIFVLVIVGILMIKYEVEGETNMPFKLSKVIVVGTVEGVENGESDKKWDFSIFQNNDIHFYIDQNAEKSQNLLIKSVKIDNIKVLEEPQKGSIKVYMPNSEAGRLFAYDEQFEVKEKLDFKGASQSSSTNLEIGSKGGTAVFRISNTNIGEYRSDKDKQIEHNSSLLEKIEASYEEKIQFQKDKEIAEKRAEKAETELKKLEDRREFLQPVMDNVSKEIKEYGMIKTFLPEATALERAVTYRDKKIKPLFIEMKNKIGAMAAQVKELTRERDK